MGPRPTQEAEPGPRSGRSTPRREQSGRRKHYTPAKGGRGTSRAGFREALRVPTPARPTDRTILRERPATSKRASSELDGTMVFVLRLVESAWRGVFVA